MAYIRTGMGSVSVDVDVDLDDIINDLSGAEQAALAKAILGKAAPDDCDSQAAALDAINQIRRGEYAEAITTLEREFLPKWTSRADCEAEYRKATGIDNTSREVGREIERAIA